MTWILQESVNYNKPWWLLTLFQFKYIYQWFTHVRWIRYVLIVHEYWLATQVALPSQRKTITQLHLRNSQPWPNTVDTDAQELRGLYISWGGDPEPTTKMPQHVIVECDVWEEGRNGIAHGIAEWTMVQYKSIYWLLYVFYCSFLGCQNTELRFARQYEARHDPKRCNRQSRS